MPNVVIGAADHSVKVVLVLIEQSARIAIGIRITVGVGIDN